MDEFNVGDIVEFELAKLPAQGNDKPPRWSYNTDLGSSGQYVLGIVTAILVESFTVRYRIKGDDRLWVFPLPCSSLYIPNLPGWPKLKSFSDPKNNDGRDICFKCGQRTVKHSGWYGFTIYNVCPKCNI
jgi:hypothetical protein